ncbi:hypothetical protein CONCODRAFT_18885 [Conidiobolus coronatus NRRL 28638]|uniref:Uncharacterized protein n=1 Tax=Conidiobolus coronatus (strain ATCC 28846 / CBS 209.66 / NRRL 28638) TaxID=796925 RepID=A0A137P0L2_CONC2|nr:hypothetical protein CONCODRAFT_18885 [Conidiobolus coronatus NRRL 28638]|eukprot:KXN68595.1 hypothetical protein CONCODRAFT_18885 [Conidiobolus coronatus NRRL 28638]
MSENTLVMNEITIHYPHKKKVTYYWICKKIIQLLLWTESKRAINLDEIWENSKISLREINENIIKIQQIISDYSDHLTSKPELLGFDRLRSIESTTLPSYKNAVSDRDIVGTSNAHLTPRIQQKESFFAVKGQALEHNFNNSCSDNILLYCFDGSDKIQARSFISDYITLAMRNRWSTGNKIKYFQDYLENDALECRLKTKFSGSRDLSKIAD